MGLFDEVFGLAGDVLGAAVGIATYPIAVALGVSESLVKRAIRAGCRTQEEISEWIEDNT